MTSSLIYNGTVYPCNVDIDCPGTSVCYFINKSNLTQGYCSCNVEQGSKGLFCERISASGYARIVGFSLDIAFASLVILVILYELFRLSSVKRVSVIDVRFTSLLMSAFGIAFFIIYVGVPLYWTLNPILPFVPEESTGKKRRPYSELRNIALGFNSFFYITAALNVSILWLEVAIASKRFQRINGPQLSKNYRNAVIILDIMFAIVLGLVNWYAPNLTFIIGTAILLIILVLYIYSAYAITMVINSSIEDINHVEQTSQSSKMNGMKESLLLIKRFVIQFVVLMIVWMIFHLTALMLYQGIFKKAWGQDEIVSFMLVFDVGFLFSIAAALSLVKYVHDVSTKSKASSSISQTKNDNQAASSGIVVPTKKTDDI